MKVLVNDRTAVAPIACSKPRSGLRNLITLSMTLQLLNEDYVVMNPTSWFDLSRNLENHIYRGASLP